MKITKTNIPELIQKSTIINLIYIVPWDFVPSDLRILVSEDLYVNQAAITGNNWSVKKNTIIVIMLRVAY
ncbi:hypothetical protein [Spiroplasma mirum]|uniref:hypothetical protein n=1 Tax=Spiroplasma mirum TaxID=2144 RepID=UPI0003DFF492|nr:MULTISPECIES: hypothetical protein [Spiroplasma]AHF61462.1 truncated Mg2+ transport ATPase [Spiroplasma mirum ATCC 29335]